MRALACRFLREYCYLYLQFILLQNWVPWCTYHFVLYLLCKLKSLVFHALIPFSQATVLFRWWYPPRMLWWRCCPPQLLLVLSASLSLSSTCRIHYALLPLPFSTGTSPITVLPIRSSLSLSVTLYKCWSMVTTNVWIFNLVLVVCVLLEWSPEQKWCYIPLFILIGMPLLVWFTRYFSWLIWLE
jgi:hypothetical protein